jgi:excisionase family DNA binding protein
VAGEGTVMNLVTAVQVAEAIGVSRDLVLDMARRLELPSVKIGKRLVRFDLSEVRAALDQRRQVILAK